MLSVALFRPINILYPCIVHILRLNHLDDFIEILDFARFELAGLPPVEGQDHIRELVQVLFSEGGALDSLLVHDHRQDFWFHFFHFGSTVFPSQKLVNFPQFLPQSRVKPVLDVIVALLFPSPFVEMVGDHFPLISKFNMKFKQELLLSDTPIVLVFSFVAEVAFPSESKHIYLSLHCLAERLMAPGN